MRKSGALDIAKGPCNNAKKKTFFFIVSLGTKQFGCEQTHISVCAYIVRRVGMCLFILAHSRAGEMILYCAKSGGTHKISA